VVGERHGRFQFVLVQGMEGQSQAQFSEDAESDCLAKLFPQRTIDPFARVVATK